ncbi:MAG TPA: methyltransferase domain-containing protein [Tepidisphaeraceae bacterium]|nr:methyltransferase domain-containing protein [Tepidisphaeraceae bacterium]
MNQEPIEPDSWSRWLLERRHGGDSRYKAVVRRDVERYRDRVLDAARLEAGMTFVDVGSGDGLLAFGAIDRVGPSLRVVLTDLSEPLLRHAEQLAIERGVRGQCRFLHAPADRLEAIVDGTADVVATRAVLAYVADKRAAFREFHRVLVPGGWLSIAEPIFRDEVLEVCAMTKLVHIQPENRDMEFFRLLQRYKAAQFPSTEEQLRSSPIANFSERDLVRWSMEAGFTKVHLELHIDQRPPVTDWELYLDIAPHPAAPTLREILAERFAAEERSFFERVLRPTIESGGSVVIDRIASLAAEKKRSGDCAE